MNETAATTVPQHLTGFGSRGYRTYVLLSLTLVYTLNFIDRTLITVVAQPIINEFHLTDGQWGLLAGPPFALFYALMGIPIAMWADRGNRVRIIALCIVIWSLMTAICGLASAFIWLLLFRVGVAIGEAGCTPPANSIITDYYPPRQRAGALGIYSMGVTLGGVLAQLFGGSIASISGPDAGAWLASMGLAGWFSGVDWTSVEGWRIAFVAIGLPGVVLALIVLFTVKEPPRGYSDAPSSSPRPRAGYLEAFREFAPKPTFWWLTMGAALVAFAGYGLISFQAPFFQRVHGLSVHEAAVSYGAPLSLAAAGGTFLGGWLSQRLAPRYATVAAWLPAVSLVAAVPLYLLGFLVSDLHLAFLFWIGAAVGHYAYLGAQYIVSTSIVSPNSRATTVAVLLLVVSLIGNGLGPMFTGLMSEFFMGRELAAAGLSEFALNFDPRLCGAPVASLSDSAVGFCTAYGNGLRHSMCATALVLLVAACCFLMASRSYGRDYWKAD